MGELSFRGTQSLLGSGQVLVGVDSGSGRILQTEAGATLTLGPNLTIQLQRGDIYSDGSLLNQATIFSQGPGSYILNVSAAQPWTNAGVIRVEGRPGEFESGLGGTWTNTGEISVTDNAGQGTFLHLRGNYWTNRGTIRTTNASLGLGGTFRPSAIGNLVRSGGEDHPPGHRGRW